MKIKNIKIYGIIWIFFICCQILPSLSSYNRAIVPKIIENVKETVQIVKQEIETYMMSGSESDDISSLPIHLRAVVSTLNDSLIRNHVAPLGSEKSLSAKLTICLPCKLSVFLITSFVRLGGPVSLVISFLNKICFLFVYKNKAVCSGLLNDQADTLEYIVKNTKVNAKDFCSLALSNFGCGNYNGPDWSVEISSLVADSALFSNLFPLYDSADHSKLLYDAGNQKINYDSNPSDRFSWPFRKPPFIRPSTPSVMKIIHLTDVHYDPEYVAGSNAVCEAPMCCNADSGTAKSTENEAGIWGDYRNCDTPLKLIDSMLSHIVANHQDAELILLSGDLIAHKLWSPSKEHNIEILDAVRNTIQNKFPNVVVAAAIGNHEAIPLNNFPPPEDKCIEEFSLQWLYDAIAEDWESLLKLDTPLPDSARFGGYYSTLVKPSLRIISVNTNFCYILNWWVLFKSVDPGIQLSWLSEELQDAENADEKVYIIAHIAPFYSECYAQWGHEFSRLVTRYSNTIKGQFYGHSHYDEHRIHYDVNNPEIPVGVEYIAPNNGPYNNINPAYRVFTVEETSWEILNYEDYYVNLTEANLSTENPQWMKLYSAKEDYGLEDLSPASWDEFADRLSTDDDLFELYFRNHVQAGDPLLAKGCDSSCRKNMICALKNGDRILTKGCTSNHIYI